MKLVRNATVEADRPYGPDDIPEIGAKNKPRMKIHPKAHSLAEPNDRLVLAAAGFVKTIPVVYDYNATPRTATPMRDPSNWSPIRTKSSPPAGAGEKRSIRSTRN